MQLALCAGWHTTQIVRFFFWTHLIFLVVGFVFTIQYQYIKWSLLLLWYSITLLLRRMTGSIKGTVIVVINFLSCIRVVTLLTCFCTWMGQFLWRRYAAVDVTCIPLSIWAGSSNLILLMIGAHELMVQSDSATETVLRSAVQLRTCYYIKGFRLSSFWLEQYYHMSDGSI